MAHAEDVVAGAGVATDGGTTLVTATVGAADRAATLALHKAAPMAWPRAPPPVLVASAAHATPTWAWTTSLVIEATFPGGVDTVTRALIVMAVPLVVCSLRLDAAAAQVYVPVAVDPDVGNVFREFVNTVFRAVTQALTTLSDASHTVVRAAVPILKPRVASTVTV